MIGLQDVAGGDQLLVPVNLQPIGQDDDEEQTDAADLVV